MQITQSLVEAYNNQKVFNFAFGKSYDGMKYALTLRNAKETGDSAYFEYLGWDTPTKHTCKVCGSQMDCKEAVENQVCKDCYMELGNFYGDADFINASNCLDLTGEDHE